MPPLTVQEEGLTKGTSRPSHCPMPNHTKAQRHQWNQPLWVQKCKYNCLGDCCHQGLPGHCLSQLFGLQFNACCNARSLLCKFFFDLSNSLCHGRGGRPISRFHWARVVCVVGFVCDISSAHNETHDMGNNRI